MKRRYAQSHLVAISNALHASTQHKLKAIDGLYNIVNATREQLLERKMLGPVRLKMVFKIQKAILKITTKNPENGQQVGS